MYVNTRLESLGLKFLLMIFKFFNSIQLFERLCIVIHVSFLISAIWKVTCDAIMGPGVIMGGHGDGCCKLVGLSLECLSEWAKPPVFCEIVK